MRKKFVLVLIVAGVSLTSPPAAVAQITGVWNMIFDTTPEPTEMTMAIAGVAAFFGGTSGPPLNCTWLGVRFPLSGNDAIVTGIMGCGLPTPNFDSFLFATSTGSSMNGIRFTSTLVPPIVTFSASKGAPEDVVAITKADYNASKQELKVEATSTESPSAVLTLTGFGEMTYKANKDLYELKVKPVANPGTVTVTSDRGGSDTATVVTAP